GINSQAQLAAAEAVFQGRRRAELLAEGVIMQAPETVFLAADTRIEPGAVIEPYVIFGPGTVVERGAVIHAFSHLEGASIGAGAAVGPFARLRPGTALAEKTRVGNFVELKNTTLEPGAKANHLTYLGDALVGAGANVGAGTITCNYDGVAKHRTEIGAGAFIGSNSSLVAPVKIGEGAYIGSGSVISKDVAPDALALSRSPQEERPGWAAKMRERRKRKPNDSGNKGT
ncbi:MAG TPA: DapH/DapD/GlmU-related protein, partial [Methyloceanibacter sp.]|nr:DapH/DapD/GlmU-related protein [Methyloceanibacter sp.]